jgi:hypothetical protein
MDMEVDMKVSRIRVRPLPPRGLAARIALAALAALVALPAAAGAATTGTSTTSSSTCTAPSLTQPFTNLGDSNWYTLVSGQTVGSFNGTGWQLSGGATITTTTLANGQTAQVLDLPSKAKAVSPEVCITPDYPIARSMVRNVKGSEGIFFYVSHSGTSTWNTPKNTGQFHGSGTSWTTSGKLNIQPSATSGWNIAKFTFIAGGNTSRFQMYNFYVDPRLR